MKKNLIHIDNLESSNISGGTAYHDQKLVKEVAAVAGFILRRMVEGMKLLNNPYCSMTVIYN